MKIFKHLFLLSGLTLVATSCAMDIVRRCIEFNDERVWYHMGEDFFYPRKYLVSKKENNMALLALERSDPLPIEWCGETRFFCTSAIERYGLANQPGRAYIILDPKIRQLAIVRALSVRSNCVADVYLGFDPDVFREQRGSRIYTACIMKVETHSSSGPRITVKPRDKVKSFDVEALELEILKHLPERCHSEIKEDLLVAVIKYLFGDRFKDFDSQTRSLSPLQCYWPKKPGNHR